MKILFIGTVEFSLNALRALLINGKNVVGVITKNESSFNADFADLVPTCEQYHIPYKFVRDINHPNNLQFIRKFNPDVIYCFGWSSLLKSDLLSIPRYGVVGFHPAKLPFNRGRHPIIWTLCLGLSETASTFFFMDEGADTGDILSQEIVNVDKCDDAQSLYNKITNVAIGQILKFTDGLEKNSFLRIPQIGKGNCWRKRGKRDGQIDFRMSSDSIYNLVRALTRPYVGAHVCIGGDEFKVWKCDIVSGVHKNDEPGKILKIEGTEIVIKTADGAIRFLEHEIAVVLNVNEYL